MRLLALLVVMTAAPKPIRVAVPVSEPEILPCFCTVVSCRSCNVCRCPLPDGGTLEFNQ